MMTLNTFTNWLWWGLGMALALAAIAIITWALLADRSRGRRRCPKCWYDMSHTDGMRCPECGRTAMREKQFYRARRRWGIALLSLLLLLPHFVYSMHSAYGDRWGVAPLPTRALIAVLPLFNGPDNIVWEELQHRLVTGQFTDDHWRAFFDRAVAGDPGAPPGSAAWEMKYGRIILSNFDRFDAYAEALDDPLVLAPRLELDAAAPAVADQPACVYLEFVSWWPRGTVSRVRVTPKVDSEPLTDGPIVLERINDSNRPRPYPLTLPPLPADAKEIELEVTIESRHAELAPAWKSHGTTTLRTPVQVAASLESTMTPVSGSLVLDEAVRASASGTVWRHEGGGDRRVSSVRFVRDLFRPGLNNIAIGMHVEILRDGEVMHRLSIWGLAGRAGRQRFHWTYSPDGSSFVDAMGTDGAEWTMRVRSDPALAARVPGANRYWAGQYEVSLTIEDNSEPGWTEEWSLLKDPAPIDAESTGSSP